MHHPLSSAGANRMLSPIRLWYMCYFLNITYVPPSLHPPHQLFLSVSFPNRWTYWTSQLHILTFYTLLFTLNNACKRTKSYKKVLELAVSLPFLSLALQFSCSEVTPVTSLLFQKERFLSTYKHIISIFLFFAQMVTSNNNLLETCFT